MFARVPIIKLTSTLATPELSLQKEHVWHLFLSHVWGTGQDQCATIKRQLNLLMPGVKIFLDVDDLRNIGALEEYIESSAVVMIFVSKGYFTSKNCMREVRATIEKQKPISLMHDPVRGGGSLEVIKEEAASSTLCSSELLAQVFDGRDVIIWHRIKDFQAVSLKLLAEALLLGCPKNRKSQQIGLFVPGELPRQKLMLRKRAVLYSSPHNPGASAVAADLAAVMESVVSSDAGWSSATHFLLYLNNQTYQDEAGEELARELREARAKDSKTKIIMVHENDLERGGCEFGIFFDGRTPPDLQQGGLYSDLAFALYSGPFWPVSVGLVAGALGAGTGTGTGTGTGLGIGFGTGLATANGLGTSTLTTCGTVMTLPG